MNDPVEHHVITVQRFEQDGRERYRATCTCDWKGDPGTFQYAIDSKSDHFKEIREAASPA